MTNLDREQICQQFSESEPRETEDMLLGCEENLQDTENATGSTEVPILDTSNKSTSMASKATPRKKTKLSQANPPKTAAATLMEYVMQRNECLTNQPQQQNPVDAFLAGLAPALKTLPPQLWIQAKGELFNVVQKYEIEFVMGQQHDYLSTPSTSAQSSRSGSWQHDSTQNTESPVFSNALQQYFGQYK